MLLNLGELLTDSLLFFTLSFAAAVTLLAGEQLFSSWRRPPRSSGSPASPGGEGAHDGLRSSQPRSRHRSRRAARTRRRVDARLRALVLCGVNGAAGLATWFLSGYSWSALVPLATGLVVAILVSWILQNFTVAGRLLVASVVLLTLVGVAWGTWFIATLPISTLTRTLMFAGIPLLIIFLPSKLILTLEDWEVLCRKNWLRPREPLPVTPRDRYPKVSLHVPAYSEPPEIVIETLNVLSRLRYPNFEVLVIDNNTKDPSLWQPVEAHCRRLGERFRFFHLEQWPGAKAGALNFALGQTAPDAEVVGVIDADYHAEPDFLSALVGHFDDPRIGFVQSPHDYRGWKESLYQRMCYWEYKIFYWTTMVSYNERDAALTVGTMCLIRRAALEEAGGWAEWCVTEDSELAIRIHALGYSSVYVTKTFGRGLIPETFLGYKRQRFRWTYGPVQELKRHYRLSLPWPWARPSSLSVVQKIDHLNHGLDRANVGLGFLLMPLGLTIAASMIAHQETIPIPFVLWVTGSVGLVSGLVLRWLLYRVAIGASLKDVLGSMVAGSALSHTVTMASLWALFTQSTAWKRTNKFKALPAGLGALRAAQTEVLLGLGTLLLAAGLFAALPYSGFATILLIGGVFQGLNYSTAAALALLAERDVRLGRGSAPVGQPNLMAELVEGGDVS